MTGRTLPGWHGDFHLRSPMYAPLHHLAQHFAGFQRDWPGLADYQHLLDQQTTPVLTQTGKPLQIVEQGPKTGHFHETYAPRIYYTGEIQTRRDNWHDFFQFLTWLMFPRAKAAINARHIPAARARAEQGVAPGRRSAIENMLSLFDEGGAIVIATDASLLHLIRDFSWRELFWQRREELEQKLQVITFGHALYEKGLAPYVGMTANTMLLEVEEEVLGLDWPDKLAELDRRLTALLEEEKDYRVPRDLHPLPLLGLPGWDVANAEARYYDNENYFRPGRRRDHR